jgi:hypothetical protein
VVSFQQLDDDDDDELGIDRLTLKPVDSKFSHLEYKKLSAVEYVIHQYSSRREAMREFES